MRIVYGVCSEGMGHALRANAVLERLQGDDVVVCAHGRVRAFLSKIAKTRWVGGLHIIYRNNQVSWWTVPLTALLLPGIVVSIVKEFLCMLWRRPDVVVSDLDACTSYAAKLLGIRVVSISNVHQNAITDKTGPLLMRVVDRVENPWPSVFVITSFTKEKNRENAVFVPPIVRESVLSARPSQGKHLLVYQTSESNTKLIEVLQQTGLPCIVYGMGAREAQKNITFKPFSEKGFVQDLVGCRAVIANGGFTVMSEALFLGKPVLSEPVRKQYEQIMNAELLEKKGFGKYAKVIDVPTVKAFLKDVPKYKKNLKQVARGDAVAKIVEIIRG